MTNFEFWKQGIKSENFVGGCTTAMFPCGICPARKWCDEENTNANCKEKYLMWCNEEHKEEFMDFSKALMVAKDGLKIAREGWNGKNIWVRLYKPCGDLTHPFLVIEYLQGHPAYPNGSCIPWLASQSDILAEDWRLVG
jgi:hypothetical protein